MNFMYVIVMKKISDCRIYYMDVFAVATVRVFRILKEKYVGKK
jgi:hypothetical protein